MFVEYMKAAFLIFAAEMGDKTQILAMMFATKYKVRQVLIGVFLGSLLNHGLAVLFGSLLGKVIPTFALQIVAGIAFLIFAMMTLASDEDDEGEEGKSRFKAPIWIVAMAFFVGELGDKTQLAAITLSVDASFPLFILMGTVTGMVLTSSLGIFVGTKIGDRLPESLIKIVSASIFLLFGTLKLYGAFPDSWITWWTTTLFVTVILLAFIYLVWMAVRFHKEGKLTPYSKAAARLYRHGHDLESVVMNLCMGEAYCGTCQMEACAVGFIKHLIMDIKRRDSDHDHEVLLEDIHYQHHKFSEEKIIETLTLNMRYLHNMKPDQEGYIEANLIRRVLEHLLLGYDLDYTSDMRAYLKKLKELGYDLKL